MDFVIVGSIFPTSAVRFLKSIKREYILVKVAILLESRTLVNPTQISPCTKESERESSSISSHSFP